MSDADKLCTALTLLSEVVIKLVNSYPEGSTHVVGNKTFTFRNQNIWWVRDSGELEPVALNVLYEVVLKLLPAKPNRASVRELQTNQEDVRESI